MSVLSGWKASPTFAPKVIISDRASDEYFRVRPTSQTSPSYSRLCVQEKNKLNQRERNNDNEIPMLNGDSTSLLPHGLSRTKRALWSVPKVFEPDWSLEGDPLNKMLSALPNSKELIRKTTFCSGSLASGGDVSLGDFRGLSRALKYVGLKNR